MKNRKKIKTSTIFFFIFLLFSLFWMLLGEREVLAQAICSDKLDLVFVMDTSGSMNDEFATLCGNIANIVADAKADGIDLKYKILGAGNSTKDCAKQSVVGYVKSVGKVPVSNHLEDWGPGTEDIAKYYEWREGAMRVIVPMGDEGPENGDPVNIPGDDQNSINSAIAAANANNVKVYPVIGTPGNPANEAAILNLADQLANGTGGARYRSTNPAALKNAIINIIWSTWDADGDKWVNMACPCDPDDLPDAMIGCFDCDDDPVTGFDATEAEAHECFIGGLVPCGRKVDDPTTAIDESAPCTLCHFFVLIKRVVDFLIGSVAFPVLVLMMIIGGVLLLTAGGSEARIRKGKDIIRVAIIGIIIVLSAWLIIDTFIFFMTPASSPLQSWHTITCPVP